MVSVAGCGTATPSDSHARSTHTITQKPVANPPAGTTTRITDATPCPAGKVRDGALNCIPRHEHCPSGTEANSLGQCMSTTPKRIGGLCGAGGFDPYGRKAGCYPTAHPPADAKPYICLIGNDIPEAGGCLPKGNTSWPPLTLETCVPSLDGYAQSPGCPSDGVTVTQAFAQECIGIGGLDTPSGYNQANWTGCPAITQLQTYGITCERIYIDAQWVWTPTCLFFLKTEDPTQPATAWYVPTSNQ
jgi:hypothetical protein